MYSNWLTNTAAGGGRALSAHDAMGGGEVIGGGGDSATSSGWTWGWAGGKSWPAGKKRSGANLNSKEREKKEEVGIMLSKSPPPIGNAHVPIIPGPNNSSGSTSTWGTGSPWATPAGVGPNPATNNAPQRAVHVRDWAETGGYRSGGSGSGSDKDKRQREKEQQSQGNGRLGGRTSGEVDFTNVPYIPNDISGQPRRSSGEERDRNRGRTARRSPSRARKASPSQVRSRSRSVGGIFVPDSESDEEEEGGYRPAYQPPPRQSSTQPYQSRAWIPVNPNHAPNHARQKSPEPARHVYNGIYAPPMPTDSRASMRSPVGAAGRTIAQLAQPAPYDYDSQFGYSVGGRQRTPHGPVGHGGPQSGRNSPAPDPAAKFVQTEKSRKKKEEERRKTKSLVRARERKWAPRTGAQSDTEGSEEEVSSGMGSDSGLGESEDEDEDDRDRDRGRMRSTVKGWGSAMVGLMRGKRDQGPPQKPASTLAPPSRSVQAFASHPSHNLGSRNPSPNPAAEIRSRSNSRPRPAPLDLSPPPPLPHQLSNGSSQSQRRVSQPTNNQTRGSRNVAPYIPNSAESVPSNLNPSELAQFQFEQQQKEYQRQLAVQSHQPTFTQVAQHVAEQVQAQSQGIPPQHRGTPNYQQPHTQQHPYSWYGQQPQQQMQQHQPQAHALRGHASWAAPSVGQAAWGQPPQQQPSWYQQQQQQPQQQQSRQQRGLRQNQTEMYH